MSGRSVCLSGLIAGGWGALEGCSTHTSGFMALSREVPCEQIKKTRSQEALTTVASIRVIRADRHMGSECVRECVFLSYSLSGFGALAENMSTPSTGSTLYFQPQMNMTETEFWHTGIAQIRKIQKTNFKIATSMLLVSHSSLGIH